jgi:hypothetical protein
MMMGFYRFAAIAALVAGALRVGTAVVTVFVPWRAGVWWLELVTLVIDLGLLFGLMGVFIAARDRLRAWGIAAFVVTEAGIASIVGPDTVAFGIDTYQVGVVVISLGLCLFAVALITARVPVRLAAPLWIASTLVAVAMMAAGWGETGFTVGGVLFGLGFVAAGFALWPQYADRREGVSCAHRPAPPASAVLMPAGRDVMGPELGRVVHQLPLGE